MFKYKPVSQYTYLKSEEKYYLKRETYFMLIGGSREICTPKKWLKHFYIYLINDIK